MGCESFFDNDKRDQFSAYVYCGTGYEKTGNFIYNKPPSEDVIRQLNQRERELRRQIAIRKKKESFLASLGKRGRRRYNRLKRRAARKARRAARRACRRACKGRGKRRRRCRRACKRKFKGGELNEVNNNCENTIFSSLNKIFKFFNLLN